MFPLFINRLHDIRKAVLPFGDSEFKEAMFNMASYYIPVDGKTEICRNHSNYVLEKFLDEEIWAIKSNSLIFILLV